MRPSLLRAFTTALLTSFVLLASVGPASADDRGKAIELIQQANTSYEGGEFRAALRSYKEAFYITEDPRLLYRIGLTYENLANYQRAREHFELYLLAEPNSSAKDKIQKKVENLKKLEANLQASISLSTAPQGATIFLEGDGSRPVGVTPTRLPVGPGEHTVRLEMPGAEPITDTVQVEAGKNVEKSFEMPGGNPAPAADSASDAATQAPATVVQEPPTRPGAVTHVTIGPSPGIAALCGIAVVVGGLVALSVGTTGAAIGDGALAGGGFGLGLLVAGLGGYYLWIHDWTRELPAGTTAFSGSTRSPIVGIGGSF